MRFASFFMFAAITAAIPAHAQQPRLSVKLDTEAADAVLAIIARGAAASDTDWQRLFQSEGYRRLKQREATVKRAFTDSAFRAFVVDTSLARRAPRLRAALEAWKQVDVTAAAQRAFLYLPDSARIRATIYPSIKPRTNTFVFEPSTNPAIFFYLDPDISAAKFENTLAHELHHLGVGSVCANNDAAPRVVQWMGGFSEGRAVLAAAGNPQDHPHATSDAAERAIWDRDYAKVPADMRRLEQFFTDLMNATLTDAEQNEQGFAFVATDSVPQGAFYTVGYMMSRAVEMSLGRKRLVESLCNPVMFLTDYNSVADRWALPKWSSVFMRKLAAIAR